MKLRAVWNRTFVAGIVTGIALLFLARVIINESTFPDRLVAPLLLDDSSAKSDAIVVLGAGVIGECLPNLNGMRRALLAARLFKEGRAPLLVITGGSGGEHCAVADAMAQLVRDSGIPEHSIILERQSRSTWENAVRTAPLLRERNVRTILVVTDRLHMRRALGVFRHIGFSVEATAVPVYAGHLDNVSMLTTSIREAAALAYYRLRGWTAPPEGSRNHGNAAVRPKGAVGTSGLASSLGGNVEDRSQKATADGNGPLVILGASYAAGWNMAAVDGRRVINAGIAGQQSSEMLARFDADVVATRPRAVLLWGFINDIFRNDDKNQALAAVRETYTEMVKRARANGIEPILATEVTIRPRKGFLEGIMTTVGPWMGKTSYQDGINGYVMAGNSWIRELSGREGLLLLDLQATLAESGGRRRHEFAVDDGSHISADGYAALTRYAQPILVGRLRDQRGAGARER